MAQSEWTVGCGAPPEWMQKVLTPYRKMDGRTGLAAWTARSETEIEPGDVLVKKGDRIFVRRKRS